LNRRGGITFDTIRELARELPGVAESTSYGTPSFKVAGRFLLRLKEDGVTIALRMPIVQRDLLLQQDGGTFFITEHYRDYPAVLVRLSRLTRQGMAELLEGAWRRCAPARLVRAHAAAGGALAADTATGRGRRRSASAAPLPAARPRRAR
jgi:hypothetical protein